MADTFQKSSYDLPKDVSSVNSNSNPLFLNDYSNNASDTSANEVCSSHSWELDNEGKIPCSEDTDDETDQGYSCDDSQQKNYKRSLYANDHNSQTDLFDSKDPRDYLLNQYEEAQVGIQMHNKTILNVGDLKKLEGEGSEASTTLLSGQDAHEFVDYTLATPQTLSKPSLHDMRIFSSTPGGCSHSCVECRTKYSEHMGSLNAKGKEFLIPEDSLLPMEDEERDTDMLKSHIDRSENPSEEFKIKRTEEWISMIDLENSTSLLDNVESSCSTDNKLKKVVPYSLSGVTVAKLDGKTTTGIEVAKNYVSSMTATSTSAQLANHGLVVIPVLSAFVNLKVLNLSGNSIVRITARSFPRGLHMLNLSKNNISTVEGLRELTRLRVLDLSYNRISRIGHGLASCSSLKELYLGGNKISEVEGLHRLLKLNILDLSLNKIATAKCLDQLAANYNSLHTISLEGNPAQRNVGDEQVKKYVQGLLPHLVYLNKLPIKGKEVSGRTARSAITTTHQFDRSFRSEHNKLIRRGTYNHTASHRQSSSSARHSRSMSSSKLGKGWHERIPSTGAKGTHHRTHHLDLRSNLAKLQSHLSMH